MATGNQAFSGNSNYVVYEKIKKFEIDYPSVDLYTYDSNYYIEYGSRCKGSYQETDDKRTSFEIRCWN